MPLPKVGEVATEIRTITDEDIRAFAAFSGDYNPVHIDDEYAAKTRFKKRIAHGLIASSMLSKVAGTRLPGPGSIYLSQTMQYKNPVFVGDTVTAEIKVLNVRQDKPIIKVSTNCRNQRGESICEGEAIIYYEPVAE